MAVRAEMDHRTGRDVTRRLAHVQPASEAAQVALSERFNASLARLFPESNGHMWFKLFQAMDTDKSGRIGFNEFCKGVRQVMHVSPEDVQASKVLPFIPFPLADLSPPRLHEKVLAVRACVIAPPHASPLLLLQLAQLWRALDQDSSGFIIAGEVRAARSNLLNLTAVL